MPLFFAGIVKKSAFFAKLEALMSNPMNELGENYQFYKQQPYTFKDPDASRAHQQECGSTFGAIKKEESTTIDLLRKSRERLLLLLPLLSESHFSPSIHHVWCFPPLSKNRVFSSSNREKCRVESQGNHCASVCQHIWCHKCKVFLRLFF